MPIDFEAIECASRTAKESQQFLEALATATSIEITLHGTPRAANTPHTKLGCGDMYRIKETKPLKEALSALLKDQVAKRFALVQSKLMEID